MRKLIFLDIDGVLNSHDWFQRREPIPDYQDTPGWQIEDRDICPQNMEQLNRLVEATGAEVVVSSTWRIGRRAADLRGILLRNGFRGKMIGVTPRLDSRLPSGLYVAVQRGNEIQAWLDANCQQEDVAFVILDDDSDMAHLKGRLVKTSLFSKGLQPKHVEAAIRKLGEKWESLSQGSGHDVEGRGTQ